jgi:hypothetical protein
MTSLKEMEELHRKVSVQEPPAERVESTSGQSETTLWGEVVSMFMRYNITSDADKVEALKKTAEHLAAKPKMDEKDEKVVEMPGREAASC